jgi:hypothetical protein
MADADFGHGAASTEQSPNQGVAASPEWLEHSMLGRHVYRVSPTQAGVWSIVKEGETEARDSRGTRERAVELACSLAAADEPSKVVVENTDGTLADEHVFGTDRGADPLI